MLNLVVKEPEVLTYDPNTDGPLKPGQLTQLDPNDPLTYQSFAHFPEPLPLDKLILMSELQQKMALGLESKEGALRALGEEFPEEKLEEIRQEMIEDAKADGALTLVKVQIQKEIMDMTGMMPGPEGGSATPIDPMMMGDGDVLGDGIEGPPKEGEDNPELNANPEEEQGEASMRETLVQQAYGANIPQRESIDTDK
jgi:hypothetical protein